MVVAVSASSALSSTCWSASLAVVGAAALLCKTSISRRWSTGPPSTQLGQECRTGADANRRQDCRIVADVNSVQRYWQNAFATAASSIHSRKRSSSQAHPAPAAAPRRRGRPVLLPGRQHVYIDLGFFDELHVAFRRAGRAVRARRTCSRTSTVTTSRTCAATLGRGGDNRAPSGSVRTELQADCFAGVWASHAVADRPASSITQATSPGAGRGGRVGDDRIQQQAQGRVDPETWTHGSSAQRRSWFSTGYSAASRRCDTLSGSL